MTSGQSVSRILIVAPVLAVVALCSCQEERGATRRSDGVLPVYVSIPPQKRFVERIGGRHVSVSVLLASGQSPVTYDPTPRDMVRLGKARVYFRIGVPFEKHVVDKIASAFQELKVVDTRQGIALRAAPACTGHGEGESHDGHHHHHEQDPHVWMNPRLVKIQARTICKALCELDPEHRASFEKHLKQFEADLDRLDASVAEALAPLRGKTFYVFHPAFGYFAEAYGLKQVAIESEGKQPTAKQLAALIDRAKKAGVKLLFVQPQFDKRTAETVAKEIGGAVVPLDPLAEDYIENLRRIASSIKAAL